MELSVAQVITVVGSFIAITSFYHRTFIVPLLEDLKAVKSDFKEMTKSVNAVKVDHAGLSSTLGHLTDAINKLTDRLDRQEKP